MIHGACPYGHLRSFLGIHRSFYLNGEATVTRSNIHLVDVNQVSI